MPKPKITITQFMQDMRTKYQGVPNNNPRQLLHDIKQDIDDIVEKLYFAGHINNSFRDDLKNFLLSAMNVEGS